MKPRGVPVPMSQLSSSPCTPAPRGDASGKTSANPSSDASRKNPAFHGLHGVVRRPNVGWSQRGSRSVLGTSQPSKVVQDREFRSCRGLWDKNIEGALESSKSPRLRNDVGKILSIQPERSRSAWLTSNVNLVMEPPKALFFWTCLMLAMMLSMR